MKKFLVFLCAIAIVCGVKQSYAAIIDGGNIGGFDTFQDVNTGRIWLDMDSFFNMSTTTMVAAANNAGFTFATKTDVQELLDSLPLTSNEWTTTYKPLMGDAPNRELIWGSYDDGADPFGWAFAFGLDTGWTFVDNTVVADFIQNEDTSTADMNIWAYQTGAPVPEPATMLLLGSGLAGLFGLRRKLRKR